MALLGKIVGIGGGGIAGSLTAIAITDRPSLVLFVFSVSTIAGGVLPAVGWYGGCGALAGLLASVFGVNYEFWPLFTLSGAMLGSMHLVVARWRPHVARSTNRVFCCVAGRAKAGECAEHRSRQLHETRRLLMMGAIASALSPGVAACVALFVGGWQNVGSSFFWGTIILGAIVGAGLFLGFAGTALHHHHTRK